MFYFHIQKTKEEHFLSNIVSEDICDVYSKSIQHFTSQYVFGIPDSKH